ncbi:hypothetical protein FA10DRAFT_144520 [Acaromyces ingoldii]|uniref:Uncharacterized protein n=1 Tax=Acaromyces ingoldii TaxID=215250 RepID=A0A316YJP7_9BASI|nr:hypothetical protein FA10DRAFT_144520 [Acaromyces ingoldii]PWN89412.1 hypothetical protein FA10DRAFT_144520 [Acaromyces ingoldii]
MNGGSQFWVPNATCCLSPDFARPRLPALCSFHFKASTSSSPSLINTTQDALVDPCSPRCAADGSPCPPQRPYGPRREHCRDLPFPQGPKHKTGLALGIVSFLSFGFSLPFIAARFQLNAQG